MTVMKFNYWQRAIAIVKKTISNRIVIGLAIFLFVFCLFGYLALPDIIRSQAEKLLTEQLHRQVTIEKITVSPYRLSITIHKFKLMEPDGKQIFASFDKFRASMSLHSLLRLAPVVRKLKLTNPYVHLSRNKAGHYNIDDIIAPDPNKPPTQSTARFGVQNIEIVDGKFEYEDVFLPQPITGSVDKFNLIVKGLYVDLAEGETTINEIISNSANIKGIHHRSNGKISATVLAPRSIKPHAAKTDEKPFIATIEKISIKNWAARSEDRNMKKPVITTVSHVSLDAKHVSSILSKESALDLKATVNNHGKINVNGRFSIAPLKADVKVSLKEVDVTGLQPYFTEKVNLLVTSAQVSSNASLKLNQEKTGALKGQVNGDITLGPFSTIDKASEKNLLRWKSLSLNGIHAELHPLAITIDNVALNDFFARVTVMESGRFNLQDMVIDEEPSPTTESPKLPEAKEAGNKVAELPSTTVHPPEIVGNNNPSEQPKTTAPLPAIRIHKMTLDGGKIRFSDNYITPHYTTKMSEFSGSITGLSSDEQSVASVDLRGKVNNAPLLISGEMNPLKKELYIDLKAEVHGMELAPLSPYAAKYTGYGIEEGQLSFEVAYKIDNRKLTASNRLILDQLTFGAPVENSSVEKLPVSLAVSLLRSRDGVIDIELPIGGSLDDPDFSVSDIIGDAIVNMLAKAITSPFSLLASAFGGSEDMGWLEFDAGQFVIPEQGEDKLKTLAEALIDRPTLKLEITGLTDPDTDKEGLAHANLQRKLRAQKIKNMGPNNHVAPQDKIEISRAEYPALIKQVYQNENLFNLSHLVGKPKELSVAEMEKFLIEKAKISNDDLTTLGNQRAMAAKEWLITKGKVPIDKVFLRASKISDKESDKSEGKARFSRVEFTIKD
jgi:hypothetical protein